MTVVLVCCAVVGVALIASGDRLGRNALLVAAATVASVVGWALGQLATVLDGGVPVEHRTWVRQLGLAWDLRLDGLGLTMTLVVGVVAVAVLVYSARYAKPGSVDVGRMAGLMLIFAGAMIGLVLADHLILLYTFWEITSVASYLLIGNRHEDPAARMAARHALLVTASGGLAMLGGFVVIGQAAGTYRLSELSIGATGDGLAVTVALLAIVVGALSKSAQVPFHGWLTDAMVAPAPISALLHSATMVKAGVYLIARLSPIFAVVTIWRPVLIIVGLTTMFVGGLRALGAHDLKLLLAYGTISQLGLMVVLFSIGTPAATTAGWLLLVSHALFKGALFMVAGVVEATTGTRDLREVPRLGRGWRWVEITSGLSAASMAGVPLLVGFVAKESAYRALMDAPVSPRVFVVGCVALASSLTVAYSVRFHLATFTRPRREMRPTQPYPDRPSHLLVVPGLLLGCLGLLFGVVPAMLDRLAGAALGGLLGVSHTHLLLWHGIDAPLLLTIATFAVGSLLVIGDGRLRVLVEPRSLLPSARAVHLASLRALTVLSRRVTRSIQTGSLPIYSAVILATAALMPLSVLVVSRTTARRPPWASLAELPVVAVLALAALGAVTVRRRFSAAVFLGAAGYAMAGLFVVFGAPDLALTQVAVETLSTVVFVLVLRSLPAQFERQSTVRRRLLRWTIAATVGVSVFVFAIVASGGSHAPAVSREMVEAALPEGHGRNVVNVILVDFRGFDTLGEITVLAVAAIGAVALARVGMRRRPDGAAPHGHPVAVLGSPARVQRIVFVDFSVDLIFHVVVMASLWLLLAGHNSPGGGFVGGLLAGAAIALQFVAGGIAEVRRHSRFRPWTVVGAGLLLAVAMGLLPMLWGGAVLEVMSHTVTIPVIGAVTLSSALGFDVGVYLTVVGVVLMAFEAFGDEPARLRT